jgi:Stage II sporulation protein M
MAPLMSTSDLALVRGIADTRATLDDWNDRPWQVLRVWLAGALAIAIVLLAAVWVVAIHSVPDPTGLDFPGLRTPPTVGEVGRVLFRNGLVLALHSMACLAGFIAGSSLPLHAENHTGLWRWVHDKAGPLAILFVIGATCFSLITQAYVLGQGTATLSAQLGVSPALLLVGLLPHALPELVALFVPLAAWTIASRRGDWHKLLAATFVTTLLAVPVLVAAAFVEVFVSPHLLMALSA